MSSQRTALVTGGTGGIGQAIVRCLVRDGFDVIATYHEAEEDADRLAQELGVRALALDLADFEAIRAFPSRLGKETQVSVLVHNAGAVHDALLPFLRDEDWDRVLDVNLNGVFRLTKQLVRGMLTARWGRIVSVASTSGVIGQAGQANYSAAKAGLIGFTKSLARELASYGVTANSVAPGLIATPMLDDLPQKKFGEYLAAVPLGRVGEPEEVAELVAFLASERAAYITGQTLRIDGGLVTA